ncbi:MAG: AAA family ATPase, partial [Anaerolineae bacterium]
LKGFTALTELLARQGQARGQELMNRMLNRLFTALLNPLIASGGDLLIFAGDAVLAYFPHQSDGDDVLQAVRAGLRMQRAIAPIATFSNEFGDCILTMRIGIERGSAYAGLAGTPRRMELLVSGPGVHRAMQAESQAEPGRVNLGRQARAVTGAHVTLSGSLVVDDLGDALNRYEITLPTRKRGSSVILSKSLSEVLAALQLTLKRVEQLAPFVPQDMLARLVNTKRQRQLEPEFRPVAVQYINLLGLEELAMARGPKFATAVFQRYFVQAEEIITRHEGVISQVDAYARGFILLNTFGAPKVHEGTTRYAVSAALRMEHILAQVNREFNLEPPLQQCGGITYGLVYTGEIGASYRREPVIAGPAANRGARLMSSAEPGQVIIDFSIWQDVRPAFVGRELPPVNLKGIDGAVAIVDVQHVRLGTRLRALEQPLLGRDSEQVALAAGLDDLQTSRGSAWLVSGETGIGKTGLVTGLAQTARARRLPVLVGRCQPHGRHIPLFPWLDLLTGWLDVEENSSPRRLRRRLRTALNALHLPGLEDALADLLALPAPDGDPSPGTPPPLSQTAAAADAPAVILQWLAALARQEPQVIILEDIHWLDDDSLDVINTLLARQPELLLMLVLTHRGGENTFRPVSTLSLSGLPGDILVQIARRELGAQTLDSTLADWICSQAGGNPLYAGELCRALKQADAVLLDRQTGQACWTRLAPALPLSLHELLLARLDELPLPQQDLLKRVSVTGETFDYPAALALCAARMSEHDLQTALEGAVQTSFLTLSPDGKQFQFAHPLMQEAIYTTLAFSHRQAWHTRFADWLVEQQQQEQQLPLIAYHYLQGADSQKAARYGRQAGDRAREQRNYAGALDYYRQVLALPDLPSADRLAALESQADVLVIKGDYAAAQTAYARAAELGSDQARQKQAIVSGNAELLAQTPFSPQLAPWAGGGQVWRLAQQGRLQHALKLTDSLLKRLATGRAARSALTALRQTLMMNETPGHYHLWLAQFATAVLQTRFSPLGLLSLPPKAAALVRQIVRHNGMSLAELADAGGESKAKTGQLLSDLIEKGYVRQVGTGEQMRYKANFERKRDKSPAAQIWAALDRAGRQ